MGKSSTVEEVEDKRGKKPASVKDAQIKKKLSNKVRADRKNDNNNCNKEGLITFLSHDIPLEIAVHILNFVDKGDFFNLILVDKNTSNQTKWYINDVTNKILNKIIVITEIDNINDNDNQLRINFSQLIRVNSHSLMEHSGMLANYFLCEFLLHNELMNYVPVKDKEGKVIKYQFKFRKDENTNNEIQPQNFLTQTILPHFKDLKLTDSKRDEIIKFFRQLYYEHQEQFWNMQLESIDTKLHELRCSRDKNYNQLAEFINALQTHEPIVSKSFRTHLDYVRYQFTIFDKTYKISPNCGDLLLAFLIFIMATMFIMFGFIHEPSTSPLVPIAISAGIAIVITALIRCIDPLISEYRFTRDIPHNYAEHPISDLDDNHTRLWNSIQSIPAYSNHLNEISLNRNKDIKTVADLMRILDNLKQKSESMMNIDAVENEHKTITSEIRKYIENIKQTLSSVTNTSTSYNNTALAHNISNVNASPNNNITTSDNTSALLSESTTTNDNGFLKADNSEQTKEITQHPWRYVDNCPWRRGTKTTLPYTKLTKKCGLFMEELNSRILNTKSTRICVKKHEGNVENVNEQTPLLTSTKD